MVTDFRTFVGITVQEGNRTWTVNNIKLIEAGLSYKGAIDWISHLSKDFWKRGCPVVWDIHELREDEIPRSFYR